VSDDVLRATDARLSAAAPTDRPFITLCYAQSLDGSIALSDGRPLTLSSPPSLFRTHALRARHEGLLVGLGTILADDPQLTVRHAAGPNPQPVVLDTDLRTPRAARLFGRPGSWQGRLSLQRDAPRLSRPAPRSSRSADRPKVSSIFPRH